MDYVSIRLQEIAEERKKANTKPARTDRAKPVPPNAMHGVHKVSRKVGAKKKTYVYAWRGGPRLKGDTEAEIYAEYKKVVRAKTGRTPRRPRIVPSPSTSSARRTACRKAAQNARVRAIRKGMDFHLSADDLLSLGERQEWRCAVSGLKFNLEYDAESRFTYNPFGISIDRTDCAKGYCPSNVRLVLTAVNFALNDWGDDIFIEIAKAVAAKASS